MSALTEEEAATKWCPFSRVAEPQRWASTDPMVPVAAVNRGSDTLMTVGAPPHATCLGSVCMAWRWAELHEGYRVDIRKVGYCGLAGSVPP